jgi:hypothetical protein
MHRSMALTHATQSVNSTWMHWTLEEPPWCNHFWQYHSLTTYWPKWRSPSVAQSGAESWIFTQNQYGPWQNATIPFLVSFLSTVLTYYLGFWYDHIERMVGALVFRFLLVNSFTRRSTQYVAKIRAKIHSIIQKASSIELFPEILLKK